MLSENFLSILKEAAKIPYRVNGVEFKDDLLMFKIDGFSKSGIINLYEKQNIIYCHGRYERINEIENFDDLVREAWYWFIDYKDCEPFQNPSHFWVEDFKRLGYIEEKKETITKYIIK